MCRCAMQTARRANHLRPARCSVQPFAEKYSAPPVGQINAIILPIPRPQEGRFAIVTTLGAGSGGREMRSRRARMKRTAKSCGPDAAVLASSSWEASFSGMTVAKEPFTGESTK